MRIFTVKRFHALIKDEKVTFCILTYDDTHLPTNTEAANIVMRNYVRRLKNTATRQGIKDFKYYAITRKSAFGGRLFHCFITNYPSLAVRLWAKGLTSTREISVSEEAVSLISLITFINDLDV